jgi:hypothetical protein
MQIVHELVRGNIHRFVSTRKKQKYSASQKQRERERRESERLQTTWQVVSVGNLARLPR